jgi:hypothetical protein
MKQSFQAYLQIIASTLTQYLLSHDVVVVGSNSHWIFTQARTHREIEINYNTSRSSQPKHPKSSKGLSTSVKARHGISN